MWKYSGNITERTSYKEWKQRSPETVEHSSIRVQSDHPVLHRHPVNEGLLVIDEVGVRDPQLVCHPVVQGEIERDACVGEALVSPGLLEVHGDGVVLQEGHRIRGRLEHQQF